MATKPSHPVNAQRHGAIGSIERMFSLATTQKSPKSTTHSGEKPRASLVKPPTKRKAGAHPPPGGGKKNLTLKKKGR